MTARFRVALDVVVTVAILVTCVVVVVANWPRFWLAPRGPAVPSTPITIDGAAVKGESTAPVVVIEWSDYQCPYCAVAESKVIPVLQDRYIGTGRVQLVFRHLPLTQAHPRAQAAAQAAACARVQGRFWEMHLALFARQADLDDLSLLQRARDLSLDESRFLSCFSGKPGAEILQDIEAARQLRLTGTPTFIVGRRLLSGKVHPVRILAGAKPASEFVAVIDDVLADGEMNAGRLRAMSLGFVALAMVLSITAYMVVRSRRGVGRLRTS